MPININGTPIDQTAKLPRIDGTELVPVGGRGIYHITTEQVRDYILQYFAKDHINLGNVDNTSDLDKPLSREMVQALSAKLDQDSTYVRTLNHRSGDIEITKADVGLNNVDNTSDLDKPISTSTQRSLDTKLASSTFNTFKTTISDINREVDKKLAELVTNQINLQKDITNLFEDNDYFNAVVQELSNYVNQKFYEYSQSLSSAQLTLIQDFLNSSTDHVLYAVTAVEKKLKAVEASLEQAIQNLSSDLILTSQHTENLELLVGNYQSSITRVVENITQDITNTNLSVADLEKYLNDGLEGLSYNIKAEGVLLRQLIKEASEAYVQDLADFQQTVNRTYEYILNLLGDSAYIPDLDAEAAERQFYLSNLESMYQEAMRDFTTRFETSIKNFENQAEAEKKEIDLALDAIDKEITLQAAISAGQMDAQTTATRQELNNVIVETKTELAEEIDNTNKVVDELVNTINSKLGDVNQSIQDTVKDVEDRLENNLILLEERLNKVSEENSKQAIKDAVDQANTAVDNALDIIISVNDRLDLAIENNNVKIEGIEQELLLLKSQIQEENTEAIAEAVRNITTMVTEVDGKVLSLSEDVLRLSGSLTETADRLLTKVDSSVLNDYYTSQEVDNAVATSILNLKASLVQGGTNLLLDTAKESLFTSSSNDIQYHNLYKLSTETLEDLCKDGDTFTISLKWAVYSGLNLLNTPANSKASLILQWDQSPFEITQEVIPLNNLSASLSNDYTLTFKVTSWLGSQAKFLRVRVQDVPVDVSIIFKEVMLERGERRSTWVPAFQDTLSEIQTKLDVVKDYILATHRDEQPLGNVSNGAGLLSVNRDVLVKFESGINVLSFKKGEVSQHVNITTEDLVRNPESLKSLIESLDEDDIFTLVGTNTLGSFSFKNPEGNLLLLRDLLISCGAPQDYLESWGETRLPVFIGKKNISMGLLNLFNSSLKGLITRVPITFVNGLPTGIENNSYQLVVNNANAEAIFTTNAEVSKLDGKITAQAEQLLNLVSVVNENKADLTNRYYTKSDVDSVLSQQITKFETELEIGGRNYLLNSQSGASSKAVSSAINLYNIRGRTICMSFDINITTAVSAGTRDRIGFESSVITNGTLRYIGCWLTNASTVGTYKGRISNKYQVPLNVLETDTFFTSFTYSNQTSGGSFTISNVKLEVSKAPTDWTPAPEDIINSTNSRFNEVKNYVVTTHRNGTFLSGGGRFLKRADGTVVQSFSRGLNLIVFDSQGEKSTYTTVDTYANADITPLITALNSAPSTAYFLLVGTDAIQSTLLFGKEDALTLELKNLLLSSGATEEYLKNWTSYQIPVFIGRKGLGSGNGACHLLTSTVASSFIQVPLIFVNGVPTTTLNGVQELVNKSTADAITTTKADVNRVDGQVVAQANQILQLSTSVDNTNSKLINDYYTKSQTDSTISGNLTTYKAQLKDQSFITNSNNLFSYTETSPEVGSKSGEYTYTLKANREYQSFFRFPTTFLKVGDKVVLSCKVKFTSGSIENFGFHNGGLLCRSIYINNEKVTTGSTINTGSTIITSPSFVLGTEVDLAIEYEAVSTALDNIGPQLNRGSNTEVGGQISYVQIELGDKRTAWKPSLKDQSALDTSISASSRAVEETKASVDKIDGRVTAQAEQLLELESEVDGNQARLVQDYYTKAQADSVIAEEISVLSTSLDDLETTIERDYYTAVKAEEAIAQGIQRYEADTSFRYQSTNLYPSNKDKFTVNGKLPIELEDNTSVSPTVLKLVNDTRITTKDTIKVDPNRLYKLRFRIKRVEGEGAVYLGLVALNYDKSKYIRSNTSEADAIASNVGINDNYLSGSFKPALGSWSNMTYYIKGISTSTSTGTGGIDSPRSLPKGTVYIAPLVIANYTTTGVVYLDYVILEEAEYAAGIDANAKAITTTNAEVTRINGQVVAQAQQLTSLDSKTNSSASFPLGNSPDTTKKNQWLEVVLERPSTEPYNGVIPDFSKLGAYKERSISYKNDGSTLSYYANAFIYYRTIVTVATAKTVSFTNFRGDDAHAIYVNGSLVYNKLVNTTMSIASFDLPAGTNIIDVVVYDGTGAGGFLATPNLSTLVDSMYAPSNIRLDVQSQAALINDRYTKSETNSAIASEITKLDASLSTTIKKVMKGVETILDLSTLDPDTWYAVTYKSQNLEERSYVSIQDGLTLHQAAKVPWSIHSSGRITISADWSSFASEWGARPPQLEISNFAFNFSAVSPLLNIGQLNNSSLHYFYLRGGAKYRVSTTNVTSEGLVILTEDYTARDQTLKWSRTDYNAMTTPVSTVSRVQATATNLQALSATVSNIDGRVTSEADRITQLGTTVNNNQSNLLENYYSKSDLDSSTTGRFAQFKSTLLVGGRNTLSNSSLSENIKGWFKNGSPIITFVTDTTTPFGQTKVIKIVATAVNHGIYQSLASTANNTDEWFTASIWMRGETGGEVVKFLSEAHKEYESPPSLTLTDKWKRFSVTAKRSSTGGSLVIYSNSATFYAAQVQYERGTLATQWQEAPEDTDSKIAAAVTATNSLSTTVTEVNNKATATANDLTVLQGSVRDVTTSVQTNTTNIANLYTKNEVNTAISGSINSFTSQLKSVKEASILSNTATFDNLISDKTGVTLVTEATGTLGKVIRITANASVNVIPSALSLIVFDPDRTYKVSARIRRVSGSAGLYIGVQAVNESLTRRVNPSNALQTPLTIVYDDHYTASNVKPTLGTWTEYTYIVKGLATAGSSGSGTIASPRTMANLTRYIRPVVLATYQATESCVQEIDYVKIEDITDSSRIDVVADSVGGLSTQVSSLNGKVTAGAQDVTNLTASLNNLQIGGANLLKTTNWQTVEEIEALNKNNAMLWSTTYVSSVLPFTRPGGQTLGLRINAKAGVGPAGFMTPALDGKYASVIAGRTYTLSFIGQGSIPSLTYCYLLYPTDVGNFVIGSIPITSTEDRRSITFVAPTTSDKVGVLIGANRTWLNTDWFSVAEVKLEEGSYATDWQPNTTYEANALATAYNSLQATVTQQGKDITSNSTQVTQLSNSLPYQGSESNYVVNANLNPSGGSPFTFGSMGIFNDGLTNHNVASITVLANTNSYPSPKVAKQYQASVGDERYVSVNPGYEYIFEAEVYTTVARNIRLTVDEVNATGATQITTNMVPYLGSVVNTTVPAKTWTKLLGKWTVPVNITCAVFSIRLNTISSVSDVHIKGIKLYQRNALDIASASAVSSLTSEVESIDGVLKSQATSLTELSSSLSNVDKNNDNLINYAKLVPGSYSATGVITTNITYTDVYDETYYPITAGTTLRVTKVDATTIPSGSNCRIIWYDSSKVFISASNLFSNTQAAGTSVSLTSPANTAFYRYCLLNNRDRVKLEIGNSYTGWDTSNESGFNTSRLSVLATTVNGIRSQYMVKMETNGVIGGFGLMQNKDEFNNVITSFGVNADSFFIGAPTGGKKPFIVTTTTTTVDGKEYPAGTWINSAIIANATIGTAQIADAAITSAKIDALAVTSANIQDAAITTAKIADLAVGTAQISDLSVETLKIKDRAVSVPWIFDWPERYAQTGFIQLNQTLAGNDFVLEAVSGFEPNSSLIIFFTGGLSVTLGTIGTNIIHSNFLIECTGYIGSASIPTIRVAARADGNPVGHGASGQTYMIQTTVSQYGFFVISLSLVIRNANQAVLAYSVVQRRLVINVTELKK